LTRALRTFEIARRDFVQRARSKAFIVTTAITIAAVAGLVGP
jgi:hypothetical protein